MFNFHNKKFKITLIEGPDTEVNESTIFEFTQDRDIIIASYCGGKVVHGRLIGKITGNLLKHKYIQINYKGELNSGNGDSKIEINEVNKIQIIEKWKWENKSGNGRSIMTEI